MALEATYVAPDLGTSNTTSTSEGPTENVDVAV